jgi:Ca2+-binding RTX toxin-like protein
MSGRKYGQFGLEALENRRLLSASLRGIDQIIISQQFSAQITSRGTLVILGSSLNDVIGVKLGRGTVVVTGRDGAGALVRTFDASQVKRIRVEGGAGDDHLGISGDVGRHCTLVGGTGNDTLGGNAGDILIGCGGNDKLVARQEALPNFVQIIPSNSDFANGATAQSLNTPLEGPSVLRGGNGRDILVGGAGDTLIGGAGNDRLHVLPLAPTVEASNAVLPAKIAPEGPALLAGGGGDDTLIADASDSVIGGTGNDLAIEHVYYGVISDPPLNPSPPVHLADDLPAYARQQFGDRASGVEQFDVSIDPQPQGILYAD